MAQPQQTQGYSLGRDHRVLDEWAMRTWGDIVEGADKPTFGYIDFRYNLKGKVREIELGVNLRKQGKEGKIVMYPTVNIFRAFIERIIDLADGKTDDGLSFQLTTQMVAGRRVDTPVLDVVLYVGKDEEGVWWGLNKKGYPFSRNRFKAPMNWALADLKGQRLTEHDASRVMAKATATQWLRFIEDNLSFNYMNDESLAEAKEEKRRRAFGNSGKGNQGGQQGGYSKPQNGGQAWGNAAPAASAGAPMNFDDEIPF